MRFAMLLLAAAGLSGCVVMDTYAPAECDGPGGARNGIQLGFSGSLFREREYVVTDGYVYGGGGRHNRGYAYTQTYSQNVVVRDPNAQATINYMEDKGFIVRGMQPKFIIDIDTTRVNTQKIGDFWLWFICSLTTCDRAQFRYTIKVKVYEAATGDMVFTRTFEHEGARAVFNLVPVLFTASSLSNDPVNVPETGTSASWYFEAMDAVAVFLSGIK